MVEVHNPNKKFGIFNACGLKEFDAREEILQFLKDHKYFVLYLNDDCEKIKNHPVIREVQRKGGGEYSAIALIVNGKGMEKFKDTFHRSSTYVDQRMVPYKEFKKVFAENQEIVAFFDYLPKEFNDIQVKGMRQIFLRKKAVSQIEQN